MVSAALRVCGHSLEIDEGNALGGRTTENIKRMRQKDSIDIIGGLLLVAVGLFAVIYAQQYSFGTLNRMGPGYFPVILGAVLAVLGLLVAIPAWFRVGTGPVVRWKTFAIVIGSVVLFAATMKVLGLILATALAVLIASLADNEITWKGRLILAVSVSAITYLVFIFGLSMVLPAWPWSY